MLIYNVTTKVDWSIAEEWVQWMQQTHIPEVIATGCFIKHQFVRLMEIDEEEGPTYAAQYFASTKNAYDNYLNNYAPAFKKELNERWGNKYIAFRSLMELID